MTQIPVMNNTSTGEHSQPVNPLTITSATLHADQPQRRSAPGHDPGDDRARPRRSPSRRPTRVDHTTMTQIFVVTVGAYAGPARPDDQLQAVRQSRRSATSLKIPPARCSSTGRAAIPTPPRRARSRTRCSASRAHGTVSNFNASTGTFTYTPDHGIPRTGFVLIPGHGDRAARRRPRPRSAIPGTVSIVVGAAQHRRRSRSSVRRWSSSPSPKFHGKNTIHIAQIASPSASGGAVIQVNINGQLDATQPAIGNIDRIIVFGGRTARNQIVVDPSVKVSTTIDSGHGTVAFLTGGGGPTREQRQVDPSEHRQRDRNGLGGGLFRQAELPASRAICAHGERALAVYAYK